MNPNNSWLNNQQWNSGQGFNQTQQGPNQMGEWQSMQQAPPPSNAGQSGFYPQAQGQAFSGQVPAQVPFRAQNQFQFQGQAQFPYQGQVPFSSGGFAGGQFRGQSNIQTSGGISGQQTMYHPQQQMSHQQMQLQKQQELERKAKEEQKQREIEIQRRKMRNMDVSKPSAGSLEELIALPTSQKTNSPPTTRHKQTTNSPSQTRSGSVEKVVPPNDDPLPTTQLPVATEPSNQLEKNKTASLEKLMESSLSNLKDPSPASNRKAAFKSPQPSQGHTSSKTFTESTNAHAWADTTSFQGVFMQHSQQPGAPPTNVPQEDTFGDFQSGPQLGGSYPSGPIPGQKGYDGSGQQGAPRIPGQPTQRLGQMHFPQGHIVNVSMANQRPIPVTSISGLTKEGYISSNVMQSRSISSYSATHQKGSSNSSNFSNLDASKFPALYIEVYKKCRQSGEEYLNTELLFPVLLSSQLPKATLRDLWTQANRAVPGKLNQTELFVLLGLIGLVQSGNGSPTLDDLKQSPQPPIPHLSAIQIPQVISDSVPVSSGTSKPARSSKSDDFGDFQQGKTVAASQPSLSTPSSQPSLAPPSVSLPQAPPELSVLLPTMPESKPPPGDKYSVFRELSPAPTTESLKQVTVAASQASNTNAGDKYGVFRDLSASSQPSTTSVISSGDRYGTALGEISVTSNSTSVGILAPSLVVEAKAPLETPAASPNKGTIGTVDDSFGGNDFDEFGAFSSGPPPVASSSSSIFPPLTSSSSIFPPSTSSSSMFPPLTSSSSMFPPPTVKGQGWADFSQLDSQLYSAGQASTTTATATAPTATAPIATATSATTQLYSAGTHLPASTSTATCIAIAPTGTALTATALTATSAFDDLLPAELAILKNQESSNSNKNLNVEVKSTPDTSPETNPKLTKQLTGLEILEEKFSNRLTSSSEPSGSSLFPVQSLVPETASSKSATSLDNFGDFEGYSEDKRKGDDGLECNSGSTTSFTGYTKTAPDPCKVWGSCLDKCCEVLSSCVAVFTSVEDKTILKEIAQSEEGRNKLRGIVEVYRLARRIYHAIKERKYEESCEEVIAGIKKEWSSLAEILPEDIMEQLYTDSVPVVADKGKEDGDFLSDTISRCSICLAGKEVCIPAIYSLTGKPENYPLQLLFHEGQTFHSTCANFWTNVVQERLPNLSE